LFVYFIDLKVSSHFSRGLISSPYFKFDILDIGYLIADKKCDNIVQIRIQIESKAYYIRS